MILLLLLKGLMDKNLFMAGATERAIATTTVTSGAAKPSSGETTRSLKILREGVKKNGKKAVRLTAWVDPPSPSPEAVRKM